MKQLTTGEQLLSLDDNFVEVTMFDSKIEGSVMLYEFVLKNMIHVIRCP